MLESESGIMSMRMNDRTKELEAVEKNITTVHKIVVQQNNRSVSYSQSRFACVLVQIDQNGMHQIGLTKAQIEQKLHF